jgi:multiple sugar transport system substrate-binding protein
MIGKQRMTVLSVLAASMMLVAACGDNAATGGTTPVATTAATAATGGSTGGKVTIRWRTRPSDAAEQAVYQALSDEAQKSLPDIDLKYDPAPNQGYEDKLKTEFQSDTAPDIVWVPGASSADYAGKGWVYDLKPLMDKDSSFKLTDFYEGPVSELTHDGKIWGVPRDVSTMAIYYNADLFKAKNLPTPSERMKQGKWNWDTLRSSAKGLTNGTDTYGLGLADWWGPWGYFVYAAGGSFFNKDRTATNLDSPESVAGLQYLSDLVNVDKSVPLPTAANVDAEALFNAGKLGMIINGRWFTPGVREKAKFAWDVEELPMGKVNATWLFWGPYIMNAKTTNPDAAWKVMKAITSAEAMGKVAAMGTNIPARKDQSAVDMFLKSTPPANNAAFIAGTKYATSEIPLWTGNWGVFMDKNVQPMVDKVINGQLSAADFGKQIKDATTKAFTK